MNDVHQNQLKPATPEAEQRRLKLRVAIKLMLYLGFAGIAYVFLSAFMSGDGEVQNVPSMRVDIADIEPGQANFLTWEGRPVLVYRRTDEDIVKLRTADSRIRDPDSDASEQPDFAQNAMRSQSADYFVAIAIGTGQGCTVELIPASTEPFQGQPWGGGFLDSCGQDRYDLAGRVYSDQYAGKNLRVPQYTVDGNTLVLGR